MMAQTICIIRKWWPYNNQADSRAQPRSQRLFSRTRRMRVFCGGVEVVSPLLTVSLLIFCSFEKKKNKKKNESNEVKLQTS